LAAVVAAAFDNRFRVRTLIPSVILSEAKNLSCAGAAPSGFKDADVFPEFVSED
jgi:hypothetical protein